MLPEHREREPAAIRGPESDKSVIVTAKGVLKNTTNDATAIGPHPPEFPVRGQPTP